MSTVSKHVESSPFPKVLQDNPLEVGAVMKQLMVLAAFSLIVASIAMLTVNLTNFSVPHIDVDAIALEFAVRCH
ncbi:hypothetical protein [Aporhodopirellula aestuarii]|uniref:Uncharacterized protein n=1 Tax=Aporhodopirellula aestuarii TaxID=2950107 RepID=A0ABT0U775_9BACT|nr:hypothetical protein [Aporhodopirellula aestuarii]MCM2372753.1 hypothetical protein [Aporhodopirellula aestuarii]